MIIITIIIVYVLYNNEIYSVIGHTIDTLSSIYKSDVFTNIICLILSAIAIIIVIVLTYGVKFYNNSKKVVDNKFIIIMIGLCILNSI